MVELAKHIWIGIEQAHQKKREARRARKDKRRAEAVVPRRPAPSPNVKETFYQSWEWRTLRMEALQRLGRVCQCCGAKPGQTTAGGAPVRIVVDHIQPISKRWELRLDRNNLQVLCDECNMGKGAWDSTDYRT